MLVSQCHYYCLWEVLAGRSAAIFAVEVCIHLEGVLLDKSTGGFEKQSINPSQNYHFFSNPLTEEMTSETAHMN